MNAKAALDRSLLPPPFPKADAWGSGACSTTLEVLTPAFHSGEKDDDSQRPLVGNNRVNTTPSHIKNRH